MAVLKAGNIVIDRQKKEKTFEKLIKPLLENIGFKQISKTSHKMINIERNQIVVVLAAPSNVKLISATQGIIKQYKKQYNGVSIYYLFTRETSDYPAGSRPTYNRSLKKIASMNKLTGVSVGVSDLETIIEYIESGKEYRHIVM
jgi:hypothetical protein